MTQKHLVAYMVRVGGRVQRVGYRRYVLESAQELGIQGYVKNERDGTVTIMAQGDGESLEKFMQAISSPPEPATVKTVTRKTAKLNPRLKTFTIKYGTVQEELEEGFGAMQAIFSDYRQEFRDYRQEFRDFRQEFRDYREEFREFARRTGEDFRLILEKYSEISVKLTTIMETLTKESKETRERLTEAIQLLREAIEKI